MARNTSTRSCYVPSLSHSPLLSSSGRLNCKEVPSRHANPLRRAFLLRRAFPLHRAFPLRCAFPLRHTFSSCPPSPSRLFTTPSRVLCAPSPLSPRTLMLAFPSRRVALALCHLIVALPFVRLSWRRLSFSSRRPLVRSPSRRPFVGSPSRRVALPSGCPRVALSPPFCRVALASGLLPVALPSRCVAPWPARTYNPLQKRRERECRIGL